jgi:hypothetical protein
MNVFKAEEYDVGASPTHQGASPKTSEPAWKMEDNEQLDKASQNFLNFHLR